MLDNYQDLIDELLGAPKALRALIARHGGAVSPEALALIAALTERDQLVLARLNEMRRATSPHLKVIPALDALPLPDKSVELDATLAEFERNRGELVSLLMNLTLRDWERSATTDAGGETTLADEVEAHVEFDEAIHDRIEAALG